MMLRIRERGFTLIELLVVIAIIGILASVVLASLNNARDKGEDAQFRQQLSSMRAEAEISYDDNSRSYDNVCEDSVLLYQDLSYSPTVGANCDDGIEGWVAEARMNDQADGTEQWFCVDSKGSATTTTGTTVVDDMPEANSAFDVNPTGGTDFCDGL